MWFEYGVLALGGFLGAVIIGSAGFAFALVATAVWLHVLPPLRVVPLVAVCAVVLNCYLVWQYRRELRWRILAPFVAGALLGVPLGVLALKSLDAAPMRAAVGVVLIGYSVYLLTTPRPTVIKLSLCAARLADGCVGWLGGLMGGATSLNGVAPTLWGQLRGFTKVEQRIVLQPYFLFTHLYTLAWLGGSQIISDTLLRDVVVCAPAMLVGSAVGLRIFRYVSETGFRRLVLMLLLVMGASLIR